MDGYERSFDKIDDLLGRANADELDDFIKAQLAQFVCILVSGAIEQAIRQVLSEHCEKKCSAESHRYILKKLDRFQNPNPEKVEQLLAEFTEVWKSSLRHFWEGEIRDAVGSVVRNRHLIAHGRNCDISLAQITAWSKSARILCAQLNKIVC